MNEDGLALSGFLRDFDEENESYMGIYLEDFNEGDEMFKQDRNDIVTATEVCVSEMNAYKHFLFNIFFVRSLSHVPVPVRTQELGGAFWKFGESSCVQSCSELS